MNFFEQTMQSEYDEWGYNPPNHAWCNQARTEVEIQFLEEVLELSSEQTILDLFCSWGRHSLALTHKGYKIIGLDISKSMIAKAKQDATTSNDDARFVLGDVRYMPFVAAFDVVYSIQSSVFEAWRTPDEALDFLIYIQQALKPEGKYLFGWPDNWNRADIAAHRRRQTLAQANYEKKPVFYFYDLKEQTALIEEAGFQVLNVYNNYESYAPYIETQPGLIMLAMKTDRKVRKSIK
jgi:cyclopropane fatty-acyl-phospholipid synthase-like methyltransferase